MKNVPNKSTDAQNGPEHSLEHSSEVHKNQNQGSVLHNDLLLALKNSVSVLCTLQVTLLLFDLFYFLVVTLFWLFWNFIFHYCGLLLMTRENCVLILYLHKTWQIFWKIKFLSEWVKHWMNNQVRMALSLSLVRTCKWNLKKKSKNHWDHKVSIKTGVLQGRNIFLPKISQWVLIINTRDSFFQGRA